MSKYCTVIKIKIVYKGHEVSVHTVNHPGLTNVSRAEVLYEVGEDRRELERLSGNLVRGMAYPFGNYNDSVVELIHSLDIEYARTVKDTYAFGIPDEFLKWHPTIHQFGKAYFTPDNPENDKKELAGFYQVVNHFLKTDSLALLNVWGHSWENDGAGDRWTEMEKFFKMVSRNPDIYYTTQIGLVYFLKFSPKTNFLMIVPVCDILDISQRFRCNLEAVILHWGRSVLLASSQSINSSGFFLIRAKRSITNC